MSTWNPQLTNYRIEEELIKDDLTLTYRGRRLADDVSISIKVVPPQLALDQRFRQRFQKIAERAIRLEHPNIISIYEVLPEEDTLYIVQELIEGRSLSTLIETEGPFSPARMLKIARQIAAALDYAHQQAITHGDLSADFIYIGQNDHVMVTNFGQTQALANTSLSKQGYAIGSPEVIAPERIYGQKLTPYADMYALGILCYHMLIKEPPFNGPLPAILHGHAYQKARSLHLLNPGISMNLSQVIERMLSKQPNLRYANGLNFIRALSVAIESTVPTQLPFVAKGYKPSPPLWKRAWLWGMVIMLTLMTTLLTFSALGAVSIWRAVSIWQISQLPTANMLISPLHPTATAPLKQVTATATATTTPIPTEVPVEQVPTNTPVAPSSTPTAEPSVVSLPTPGQPVVIEDSPFTHLRYAQNINELGQPENVALSFPVGDAPIYLFFDYHNMKPATPWGHVWSWGDTELARYQEVWAEDGNDSGTAWIFFSPPGGYQRGPYQVNLQLQGQTVATATFVVK